MNDIIDQIIESARPSWLIYAIGVCAAIIVVAVLGAL